MCRWRSVRARICHGEVKPPSATRPRSGTLTPVLKSLESSGYIKRERDKKDERILTVSLTSRGEGLKDALSNVPKAVASKMGLDKTEALELYKLLYKVLLNLSEEE